MTSPIGYFKQANRDKRFVTKLRCKLRKVFAEHRSRLSRGANWVFSLEMWRTKDLGLEKYMLTKILTSKRRG